jgi:hypothetical protein
MVCLIHESSCPVTIQYDNGTLESLLKVSKSAIYNLIILGAVNTPGDTTVSRAWTVWEIVKSRYLTCLRANSLIKPAHPQSSWWLWEEKSSTVGQMCEDVFSLVRLLTMYISGIFTKGLESSRSSELGLHWTGSSRPVLLGLCLAGQTC